MLNLESATRNDIGDLDTYGVSEIRRQFSNNLLLGWKLDDVRRDVEEAWREKDFMRVVRIYDPVKEHLTPAEAKKLEYLKKKSDS